MLARENPLGITDSNVVSRASTMLARTPKLRTCNGLYVITCIQSLSQEQNNDCPVWLPVRKPRHGHTVRPRHNVALAEDRTYTQVPHFASFSSRRQEARREQRRHVWLRHRPLRAVSHNPIQTPLSALRPLAFTLSSLFCGLTSIYNRKVG